MADMPARCASPDLIHPPSGSPRPDGFPAAENGEREVRGHERRVSPPTPAPYLAGVPQLDPHLSYGTRLSLDDSELDRNPRLRLEMQKQVRDAARYIRRRRTDFEEVHGIVIDPEEPPTE
jgi:hypothetical protein